jgi:GTP cyclohydrolase IIa
VPSDTEAQVTVFQIDNYGPWTVTPSPRREMDLQSLQTRLYADISQLVGAHGGYVFPTRFDNMVAVTNGVDEDDHRHVQASVRNRFPVTISLGVATGPSPAAALAEATSTLQGAGSAQDDARTEVLRGEVLSESARGSGDVQVAHFDVVDATGRYTDELDAFEVFRRFNRGYQALLEHMYDTNDALTFFVGGDNLISVTPDLDRAAFGRAVAHVEDATDLALQVGVGRGRTAHEAGMTAKEALERCRENGTDVEAPAVSGEG